MQIYMCIGHAAYDITLPVESYPIENTKVRIAHGVECGGGAAANAAYLLSKWGMKTYFVGAVGNDLYGERIKEEFRRINTNIDYLETTNVFRTTTSYILANSGNGSRTIIVSRDKKTGVTNLDYAVKPDVILVDGEELEASKKVLLENPDSISVIDAGNLKPNIVELCKYVKFLVCSKDFAEEYTKEKIDVDDEDSLIRVYKKIKEDYPQATLIITLGKDGSFAEINGKYELISSLKIEKPIDSTAAGDIYHGAFTYFIGNGYDLYNSIRLANIAGALSVKCLGGKNSMPELDKVLEIGEELVI